MSQDAERLAPHERVTASQTGRSVYVVPAPGAPAERLPTIVANGWQGEIDCVVGPFSCRQVAEYFANRAVDFGQFEAFRLRVLAHRDAWYVEVRAR